MVEGDDAQRAVAEASRRTTSRAELSRRDHFDEVSPEVGELDEDAFGELMEDDLDAALTLLAELTGATDERLRALALELAGRVIVTVAANGLAARRGVGRLASGRASDSAGDLDLDASLDAVVTARRSGQPAHLDDLTIRHWERPETALCLLVDCSGSMIGQRVATAAVTAAAVLLAHGHDCSVVAFGRRAVVLKAQDEPREVGDVVADLFRLRGHGVTDVGLALRTASDQLGRSRAGRRIALLLSDCRSTSGDDPLDDAAALDELAVIAPAGDTADAARLADAVGGRWTELAGPSGAPEAVLAVLDR